MSPIRPTTHTLPGMAADALVFIALHLAFAATRTLSTGTSMWSELVEMVRQDHLGVRPDEPGRPEPKGYPFGAPVTR